MINRPNHAMPLVARMYEVNAASELSGIEPAAQPPAAQSGPPPAAPAGPAPGARDARDAGVADHALPFVGAVLDYVPGQSVSIERRLSLAEDLHLADHHFVHATAVKPLSACFPVVPMTVSLEIMAEAAACLVPGYGLIGFEDVQAARWIALADTDTMTVRVDARVKEADAAGASCRLGVAVFVQGESHPAISATVLFGTHYRLSLSFDAPALDAGACRSLNAADAYAERQLFHGPRFQGLVGTMLLGECDAAVEVQVRSAADMFRSMPDPQLLTDPALLDTVGQAIAMWALQQGDVAFPVGIGKLEFYRTAPAPGTRVPMRVHVTENKGKTLTADVEIQDGVGGVWMRIRGWKSWRFQWDKRLMAFRRLPTRHLLSDAVSLAALDEHPAPVCQRLTRKRLAGFDPLLLARHYLHLDEMAAFADKRGTPARQIEWLLGRIAAKDAVRAWDARRRQARETLHPAAFAIASDEKGCPVVARWHADGVSPPAISIAHCDDEAIAIAHGSPVGIDIERIAEHDADFVKAIATESERALVARCAGSERQAWVTRLWCAKEALGKLMGTGIDGTPRHYEATAIDTDGSFQMCHRHSGRQARVTTQCDGDFIVAIGLGEVRAM